MNSMSRRILPSMDLALPVLLIDVLIQLYVVRGLTMGALKV